MSIPGSASPLFLSAAAAAAPAGYQIDRSLRFNSSDSAYLSKNFVNTETQTYTLSCWIKRCKLGTSQRIYATNANSYIMFLASDQLHGNLRGTTSTNSFWFTNAVFRDVGAWYHIVMVWDTSNATQADRIKLYVNGVEQTFTSTSFPNYAQHSGGTHEIGGALYPDFYLADVYYVGGQALSATDFGEYDDNNVWQPKAYSGTYGTNGFHLDFSDASSSAALGDDSSGNNNDWTVNNISAISAISLPGVAFSTGNLITAPSSADFNLGTGDFTIEYWLKRTTLGNNDSAVTNFSQVSSGYLICLHAGTGFSDATLYLNGSAVVGGGTPEANVWNHYAYVRSGTTCTLYKNGTAVASATSSAQAGATNVINIGAYSGGSSAITGQMSNVRIVKGVAVYTSNFTPSTQLTNVSGTVLLCCQSSSSVTAATVSPGTITTTGSPTAGTFSDTSPNQDSLVDSPTNGTQEDTGVGGEVVGNYCTGNPLHPNLDASPVTLSNGNLDGDITSGSNWYTGQCTMGVSSGKWYFEQTVHSGYAIIGIAAVTANFTANSSSIGSVADGIGYFNGNGNKYTNSTNAAYGATYGNGDTVGCAFDMDARTVTFYKNGVSQGQLTSAITAGVAYAPCFSLNGQNGAGSYSWNFGQRLFTYGAPSGYKALCTTNLPDPTIADGSTAMDAKLYTGNGSTQTISGLGFSPDLVWMKMRSTAGYSHKLVDQVRGATKSLVSNNSNAELTETSGLTAFTSDGFSLGSQDPYNRNNDTFVAWTWDGGTSTVSNTDGSVTSSVRANASAGFSIVTFTSPSSGNFTIGHGLGVAPSLIIAKDRTNTGNWHVYHASGTAATDKYLLLNTTNSLLTFTNVWGSALPTSTVFGMGVGASIAANADTVAYCFTPVAGYSAFGSYTGNGSATDAPFVYTGFRPKFLMIKGNSSYDGGGTIVNGYNWYMYDSSRSTYNAVDDLLAANKTFVEESAAAVDFLSNGFKIRNNNAPNAAIAQYYIAFAEHPLKYARAR